MGSKKKIPKNVREMIRKEIKKKTSYRKIAEKYNVSVGSVHAIGHETQGLEVKTYKDNPFRIRMTALPVYKRNWLWANLCVAHKEPYALHNKCFFEEKGGVIDPEKIGFLEKKA